MLELAPTVEMLYISEQAYTVRFNQILSSLSAIEVVQSIRNFANGRDAVLLCYEKEGEFCHRRLVAEWLKKEVGEDVRELGDMKPKSNQTSLLLCLKEGRHDIYLYSSVDSSSKFYLAPVKKMEIIPRKLIGDDFEFTETTVIDFVPVSPNEINYYKSFFMSLRVNYSTGGDLGLLFRANGLVFGFCAFSERLSPLSTGQMFIHSDFVVQTKHRQLSKLVLYLLLSDEIQYILVATFKNYYEGLKTTVYTEKAVSMKYRGVFSLQRREKGKLIYEAQFNSQSLSKNYETWMKKHYLKSGKN